MTREKLLRDLKKEARKKGLEMTVNKKRGKGAHYIVTVGEKFTTVQSGELTPIHVQTIRKQLGL